MRDSCDKHTGEHDMRKINSQATPADSSKSQDVPVDGALRRPWSLKGIDPSTIEVCKLAAQNRGMKINRWVSLTLESAAKADMVPPRVMSHSQMFAPPSSQFAPEVAPTTGQQDTEKLLLRIAKLEAALEQQNINFHAQFSALLNAIVASRPQPHSIARRTRV